MANSPVASSAALFGEVFRRARIARGLTQTEIVARLDSYTELVGLDSSRAPAAPPVAPFLGKDPSWVSRIESGQVAKLDRPTILALCWSLDCSPLECCAFLLAAGLSPYPPLRTAGDAALRRYLALAKALPPDDMPDAGMAKPRPGPDKPPPSRPPSPR